MQLRHPLLLEKVVAGWGYGSLGGWVSVQRRNEAKLSLERLAKLERFVWDALDAFWDEGFTHLQQYVAEHGHATVSNTCKIDSFALGLWVGRQRSKKDKLSPERLAKLESLGFVWDVRDAFWDQGLAHLQQYVAEHGHTRVLQRTVVEGYRLGGWVSNQRANKDQLSPERLAKLDSLGFIWDAKK